MSLLPLPILCSAHRPYAVRGAVQKGAKDMLVATLWRARTDLTQEQQQQVIPRRAQWQPKARIVGEYWFLGSEPGEWQGVTIADVNDPSELMQDLMIWADVLEMSSHVAVGVDQGLPAAEAAAAAVTA